MSIFNEIVLTDKGTPELHAAIIAVTGVSSGLADQLVDRIRDNASDWFEQEDGYDSCAGCGGYHNVNRGCGD